mgnify:CR=1 FL=1
MLSVEALAERIREAASTGERLRIRGGGSKDFYGEALSGEVLDTRVLEGVSSTSRRSSS